MADSPLTPPDLGTSVLRTAVPYATAGIVAYLAKNGMTVDGAAINVPVTFAVGTVWYTAVRFLENKWPSLGWLLGTPKAPVYGASVMGDAGVIPPAPGA